MKSTRERDQKRTFDIVLGPLMNINLPSEFDCRSCDESSVAMKALVSGGSTAWINNVLHLYLYLYLYLYLPSTSYWVKLCSSQAKSHIATSVLKVNKVNAPVSFAQAVEPYLVIVQNETKLTYTSNSTVCLGGARLSFEVKMVRNAEDKPEAAVVFSQIGTTRDCFVTKCPRLGGTIPNVVFLSRAFTRIRTMMLPFTHDQQTLVLYWIGRVLIGEGMCQPSLPWSCTARAGKKGRQGKGAFLERLKSCLKPVMRSPMTDAMDFGSKAPSDELLSLMSDSR
eukprot:gene24325-9929_t